MQKALKDLGYVEGENFVFEYALAKRVAELPKLATQLVQRKVDVIVASGTPAVIPARNATNSIPIVFIAAIDPVATGMVNSLAQPGGNMTGLTSIFSQLAGKRLQVLKEIMPSLKRVALFSRPRNPGHYQYVQNTLEAARILRVELDVVAINSADEFEAAFRKIQGVDALIQIDDAMFTSHRKELVELAVTYRIPGAYGFREFVDIGGFMALGPSYPELYRRAASYIDKILKGQNPADLPVEQPSKFEFILNLKAAKGIGLTVPPAVVARADELIE
jgi:putative ABC transport system substrate-binding protein